MRSDDKTEWECEKCGIFVIACIPQPGESTLCLECRFIENIEDPTAKQQAEEWLKKRRGNASNEHGGGEVPTA